MYNNKTAQNEESFLWKVDIESHIFVLCRLDGTNGSKSASIKAAFTGQEILFECTKRYF